MLNTLKQTKTTIAAFLACIVFFGLIVTRFVTAPKSADEMQPEGLAEPPTAAAPKSSWRTRAKQWLPRKLQSAPDGVTQ